MILYCYISHLNNDETKKKAIIIILYYYYYYNISYREAYFHNKLCFIYRICLRTFVAIIKLLQQYKNYMNRFQREREKAS
jgi:hypothetical protein